MATKQELDVVRALDNKISRLREMQRVSNEYGEQITKLQDKKDARDAAIADLGSDIDTLLTTLKGM